MIGKACKLLVDSINKALGGLDAALPGEVQRNLEQVCVGSVRELIAALHVFFLTFRQFLPDTRL